MRQSDAEIETIAARPIRKRGSPRPHWCRSGHARACIPASVRQVPRRRCRRSSRLACESPRVVDRDRACESEPCVSRARVSALGCQLRSAGSWVEGAVRAAGRSLPGMSLAVRAHGSNQRFHRLLGHAVSRALTHQASPASARRQQGFSSFRGGGARGRPGRCCTNRSETRCVKWSAG
jgi:hypothetical protein